MAGGRDDKKGEGFNLREKVAFDVAKGAANA